MHLQCQCGAVRTLNLRLSLSKWSGTVRDAKLDTSEPEHLRHLSRRQQPPPQLRAVNLVAVIRHVQLRRARPATTTTATSVWPRATAGSSADLPE